MHVFGVFLDMTEVMDAGEWVPVEYATLTAKLSHEARSLLAEAQSKDDAAKQKAWFKTLSKVLFQNRKLLDGKDPLGPATSRELEGLTKEIQVATTEGVVYVQGLTTAS